MLKISKYAKKSEELRNKIINAFGEAGLCLKIEDNENEAIRLVFAGQYSAGKSSILKMLTGREDIAVGAGITTQETYTYSWNGMEVVDTPGIHTELRADHDRISYNAIASADMLVFVVTNELFDSHLAEHFRKLAIDRDKAGEMILVVNKMERASEGNTASQQEIIREALRSAVEPYTPEQLNLCFVDANSYLESLQEEDPEIAQELRDRSGYDVFIETLNDFVAKKSMISGLTTELYVLDEKLQEAIHKLEPKSTDTDLEALEEVYHQQRHVLTDSRIRLNQELSDIFSSAAAEIRNIGLDSANLLFEGCKQEEVEESLGAAIRNAQDIIEQSQRKALAVAEARMEEINRSLEGIEESDFTKELNVRLEGKFEKLPDNVKKLISGAETGIKTASEGIAKNAYKTGVSGGMKTSNFSSSNIHKIVLKVGHKIGYKFQPWEAVKITKGIAIGGKILGVLGVVLSVAMQIKSDRDEEKVRISLANERRKIRSQFNEAADGLEEYGKGFAAESIRVSFTDPIEEVNEKIAKLRSLKENRSAAYLLLEGLQSECRQLICEIHNS